VRKAYDAGKLSEVHRWDTPFKTLHFYKPYKTVILKIHSDHRPENKQFKVMAKKMPTFAKFWKAMDAIPDIEDGDPSDSDDVSPPLEYLPPGSYFGGEMVKKITTGLVILLVILGILLIASWIVALPRHNLQFCTACEQSRRLGRKSH